MKQYILFTMFLVIFCSVMFLCLYGMKTARYEYDIEKCCDGYREWILDGQIGGECFHVTKWEYFQGIGGCTVKDLRGQTDVR